MIAQSKNNKVDIKSALDRSYEALVPYSEKYRGDKKRFLRSLEILSKAGVFTKRKQILEIGCGIGIMAVACKLCGADVYGIDKFIFPDEDKNLYTIDNTDDNFTQLQRVWDEYSINISSADIENEALPFANEKFDLVNFDATIEHLKHSPKMLFAEVRRVLKKDGLFLVTTPNLANLLRRVRFMVGRSPNWDVTEYFNEGPNFRGHRREFTLKELISMLLWSEFQIESIKTYNVFSNYRRLLKPKKVIYQLSLILSVPFTRAREMLYVLGKK